ncbi:solute carrier organic anion transporter family member 74D-like isoform X1 [Macrobrachium nipponense]|uniref:solute carrier organic anion transporter family member 74D-like isoform X1 n=2 Tax=Macrobrachium nipponense TaxID=159736 RepID=UPI0030C89938
MENKSFSISEENSSGKENGTAAKENGRTTYPSALTPAEVDGGDVCKTRLEFHEKENVPAADNDTNYMCGAFGRYPKWMQRFASPRWFLVAYCIQNIIAGAESTFLIGCTSSIEKHFQFSSGDMGLIILLSEIGPIITTMLLSYFGGRGNRPRWLAIGLAIGGLGVLIIFSTFLIYPAPVLSESGLLDNSKKFCDIQDIINFQFLNATTTASSLSLDAYSVESQSPSCQGSNNLAFILWLMGFTCKALSGTILYIVGAPYLDDSVSKNAAPIYFAISTSVRVLGPTIGFALSAFALNIYVYPGQHYGISPHDPRWIGAWWTGPLAFSTLMLAYAFTLSLFPRKIKRSETAEEDLEGRRPAKEDGISSRQLTGEDLVKTSVVPTNEDPPYKIHNGTNGHLPQGHHQTGYSAGRSWDEVHNDLVRQFEAGYGNSAKTQRVKGHSGNGDSDGVGSQEVLQEKTLKKNTLETFVPQSQINTAKDFLEAVKRLSRNPVLLFLSLSDLFALIAELGLFMWLAKYQEHQFRITKSSSTFFSGISSTTSLLLGVAGGGVWIRRFRPKGKTVAYLMAVGAFIYTLTLVGVMFVSCDFQQDLPGILSPDGRSVELYRGCSSGCDCDLKEFIPVCVRDGPINLTYFSPCHAGCPETRPPPPPEGDTNLLEGAADGFHREVFFNCTCGSPSAKVTSGYCQDTCSEFIVYNVIMVIVRSFISVGIIGGTLIGMRCVSVEDKPLAIGVKTSMVSAALIVNPLIYGSLIDSSCLVWEETCQNGRGSCWLYNTDDFRYKLHGVSAFFIALCSVFCFIVARKIGDLQLLDENPPCSTQSSPASSFLFSSGPGAGRKSSLRRSLKKISRLVGRENGGSRSPGRKKEEKEGRGSQRGMGDGDKQAKRENDVERSHGGDGSNLQPSSPVFAAGNMLPSRIVKTTGV